VDNLQNIANNLMIQKEITMNSKELLTKAKKCKMKKLIAVQKIEQKNMALRNNNLARYY
jgi:hypothetical protein